MNQLTIDKTFNQSITEVFRAWCEPAIIKQWFAPEGMQVPEATADAKVGGHYRIVMQDPDGEHHIVGGKYLEVIENQKLVFTWQWEGSPHVTQVEINFLAVSDNQTQLTLQHKEFIDQEMCDKHEKGWNSCLQNLTKLTA